MTAALIEETRELPLIEAPEDRDAPEGFDPDAPYGRRANGQPYKRPQETRQKLAAALNGARASRGTAKAPGRARTAKKAPGAASPAKGGTVDYRPAVVAALQIPIMALSMVGRATGDQAWTLDAATIQLNTGPLAEIAQDTANESESVAALLDKLMIVGPWGKVATVVLAIGAQIAANHRAIPCNPELGILDADGLAEALARQAAGG